MSAPILPKGIVRVADGRHAFLPRPDGHLAAQMDRRFPRRDKSEYVWIIDNSGVAPPEHEHVLDHRPPARTNTVRIFGKGPSLDRWRQRHGSSGSPDDLVAIACNQAIHAVPWAPYVAVLDRPVLSHPERLTVPPTCRLIARADRVGCILPRLELDPLVFEAGDRLKATNESTGSLAIRVAAGWGATHVELIGFDGFDAQDMTDYATCLGLDRRQPAHGSWKAVNDAMERAVLDTDVTPVFWHREDARGQE